MITAATRVLAAFTFASAGINLSKASKALEDAKDALAAAERERVARRRAEPLASRFTLDATTGPAVPKIPAEAVSQITAMVLNFVAGAVLTAAATKLGRR